MMLNVKPDQKCRKCGAEGYSLDEFLSPYTGLCAGCSPKPAPRRSGILLVNPEFLRNELGLPADVQIIGVWDGDDWAFRFKLEGGELPEVPDSGKIPNVIPSFLGSGGSKWFDRWHEVG